MSSTVPPTVPPPAGSPQTNGSSAPPLYSTRFKLVAVVLVAIAVGAAVAGYLAVGGGDDGVVASGGTREFVERLIPGRDSQIVQQGTVGIDLTPGWEATLVVDEVAIPPADLKVTESLNLYEFTPGEGKVMESLPVGDVCVEASVWETASGPGDPRRVSWCFDVI